MIYKEFYQNHKKFFYGIIQIMIVIGVALLLTLFTNTVLNKQSSSNTSQSITPVQVTPYQAKDSMNKLTIIKDYSNTTENGQPVTNFKFKINTIGSVDSGYLYVKASADGEPLNQYESVYLKIQDNHILEQLGGNLVQEKSFPTPESSNYTEFLYSLDNVFYKSENQNGDEVTSANWLKMLNQNQGDLKTLIGFSSTLDTGTIEEVSIFYKCSIDSNCFISAENIGK